MTNLYECKAHYIKTLDTGTQKPVNEPYMVDAMSVTEAEARVIEELAPILSNMGGVTVISATKSKISEVEIDEAAESFYRAKVALLTIDAKTGTEKRTPLHILIQANSFDDARNAIDKHLDGTNIGWEVESIMLTPIVGYIPSKDSE